MNIAVIQARMASKRLPQKALLEIESHPLIYYVIKRGQKVRGVEKVVLATSRFKDNDELVDYAKAMGIEAFRGDEDNVLERFYTVAEENQAKHIIRLTGDNPLLDFTALSFLLEKHSTGNNDYSCITGLPVGASGDIFSFKALEESYTNADGKDLCDHVDLYVLENQDKFKIVCYDFMEIFSSYRWTVDEQRDLDNIRRLFHFIKGTTNHKIEDLDTKRLLELIKSLGFQEDMQPVQANISERNLYTTELVNNLDRRVPIRFEEVYNNDC